MANYFNLTLDTTAPAGVTIAIEGGATYATSQVVSCAIGTSDGVTTGYKMKIYGSVDNSYDANIQDTEGASAYISYASTKNVKLSAVDGMKTLYVKVRDDLLNVSDVASSTIVLDISIPAVTITGPDVPKISKNAGKNVASFSFVVDQDVVEYKIKVVPTSGSAHTAGTTIPVTAGSTNMTYNGVAIVAATVVDCTINGADLETASSGDGAKIVKVFVKEASGNWSS